MKLLKQLFSKLFTKSSKEEEEEFPVAYIMLGINSNDEEFIQCEAQSGREPELAKILFLFNSASLIEVSMEAMRQSCEDDAKANIIEKITHDLLLEHVHKKVDEDTSEPVIDPLSVFKPDNNN